MDEVVVNTSNQTLSPTGPNAPSKKVYETPFGTCTAPLSTSTAQTSGFDPAAGSAGFESQLNVDAESVAGGPSVGDPASSPQIPPSSVDREAYLEQVRRLAAEETRVRAEASRARDEALRKRKEASMLTHERLLARRQERALAAHAEWQREWAHFKQTMCALSGKDLDDLVISRADSYRERMEEYNYISAAIPHHEKHGSEYWKMSLRGLGTRYVAVGNIFSGLFCPVNESSKNEMQMVRIPRLHKNSQLARRGIDKPSWRDSPILQRRQRNLAGELRKLRPHLLTDEDADALVLRGEPLLEWAYVSMEVDALDEAEQLQGKAAARSHDELLQDQNEAEEEGLIEKSLSSALVFSSREDTPRVGPQCELLGASAVQALGVSSPKSSRHGHEESTQASWAISFATVGVEVSTHVIHLHNTGSTALFFRWTTQDVQPAAADNSSNVFYCSAPDGVVLPDCKQEIVFSFASTRAGAWKQVWTLDTTPTAHASTGLSVELRAVCDLVDDTRTQRFAALDQLVLQGEKHESSVSDMIVQKDAAEAQRIAEEDPEYGLSAEALLELRRKRFETANRALGLYYHPALEGEILELARSIFSKVHAYDMVFDPAHRDAEIDAKVDVALQAWKRTPSLVALRVAVASIARGDPLRPRCRAPTIIDEIARESEQNELSSVVDDADETGEKEGGSGEEEGEGEVPENASSISMIEDNERLVDAHSEIPDDAKLEHDSKQTFGEDTVDGDGEAPNGQFAADEIGEDRGLAPTTDDVADDAASDATEDAEDIEYVAQEYERLNREADAFVSGIQTLGERMVRPPLVQNASWARGREAIFRMADSVVDVVDTWREEHPDESTGGVESARGSEGENEIDPMETLHGRAAHAVSETIDAFMQGVDSDAAASRLIALQDMVASVSLDNFKLCSRLDQAGDLFAGVRVLLTADLAVRASEGDTNVPDEIDIDCKLKSICKTVEWLVHAGCASVLIADGSSRVQDTQAVYSSVAEELGTRLGREVVFISDLTDEDAKDALGLMPQNDGDEGEGEDADDDDQSDGSATDEDEDQDEKSSERGSSPRGSENGSEKVGLGADSDSNANANAPPRARVEPDDVAVLCLDARPSISRTGDLAAVLATYAEVVVHDSLYSMQTYVATNTDEVLLEHFGGFGVELDAQESAGALKAKSILVIGGEPNMYPKGQGPQKEAEVDGDNDRDSGSEDEDEDEDEDDENEDEQVEEEESEEEAVAGKDSPREGQEADDDDNASVESESSAGSSSGSESSSDGSISEPEIDPSQAGFMRDLAVLEGAIRSGNASAVLIVGPLANLFERAVAELGAAAKARLLLISQGDQAELVIPEESQLICSPLSAEGKTVAARELEWARTLLEQARLRRVMIKVFSRADARTTRQELTTFVQRTDAESPVLFLNAVPEEYATRLLLRQFGKAGNEVVAYAPQVWTQLDTLKSGAHEDDSLEEEMDEEDRAMLEDNAEAEEDEDEEDAGNEDSETANKDTSKTDAPPAGGDGQSNEEDEDPYRLQDVKVMTWGSTVRQLLSLQNLEIPQGLRNPVKVPEGAAELETDVPEETIAQTSFENLKLIASLVPARVIRYHLEHKDVSTLQAFSEEFEGAVLFADISGFSSLAEKLAKDLNCAANAAENLSSYIGKSLEKMVHEVCSKGGDVIKFAGDAILAVFPASKFRDLNDATLCCIQVAMNLLQLDLKAGGVQLSIHCGVGAGSVVSYHVGGRFNRWEYVITGDPIEQIGSAEPEASAGEVVIAKSAYERIASELIGKALPSGNFRIDKLRNPLEPVSHPFVTSELECLLQEPTQLLRMDECLRSYVPRPVLQAIDAGQSLWFSELRLCSTLFCRLKGLKFNSRENLDLIHRAVRLVQKNVYAYEGTLCRFIVDDKGAGLLLAFGLPPFMHENDPVRATRSALDICAALSDLVNDDEEALSASIGVTSGRVFCGTTGGGVRCEYTLHGTLVNLAARYMVAAKTGVLCGQTTYREACEAIEFGEPEKLKVKGKEEEVLVYRPIGPKAQQGFENAKSPLLGRTAEMEIVSEALQRISQHSLLSEVVLFTGEAGIGKSRLMQETYAEALKFDCGVIVGKGQDTESATAFYVFRSILSQLVNHYFTKVVWYRFEVWQEIVRQSQVQGVASAFSENFAQSLYTKYLSKSFFERLEEACRPQVDSSTDAVGGQASSPSYSAAGAGNTNMQSGHMGGPQAQRHRGVSSSVGDDLGGDHSTDFLKYMGLMENPISSDFGASPEPSKRTIPPLESLPDHLRLHVVRDMIPVGKDNLEEMYPLLSILIPKVVQGSDTETTAKMRNDIRAENRMRLIKEIFTKCAAELESLHELQRIVEAQAERRLKALSRLGVNIDPAPRQDHVHGSSQNMSFRGASTSGSEETGLRAKRRGKSKESSSGAEDEHSTASLAMVDEHQASPLPEATSPGSAGSRQQSSIVAHRSSYRMRMGSGRESRQSHRIVLMVEDLQFVDPLEGMCKWLEVKDVPDKALSAVMVKSLGHPLFSEELTKLMVAEGMILIDGDTARLSKKAQEGTIGLPDTVSALMTSKLDRLKPSQQLVLKVAAVIGTEFQRNELAALMPKTGNEVVEGSQKRRNEDHDSLSDDVSALVAQNLLIRNPHMMYHYRFTSAMLRESAYNLLLYQNRKDLHKKLAEYQEARNKDYLEPVYFLLATNYFLAEEYEKALHYSELAGKNALEAHALQQVFVCFSRLIEMDQREPTVTEGIPLSRKIGWKRKVGEALFFMGKPVDAEEYLLSALEDANLQSSTPTTQGSSCFGGVSRSSKLHLVKFTPGFAEMEREKNVQLLLEASAAYELLAKMNFDRSLPSSLEYRLNAIDTAKTAESALRETQGNEDLLEIATGRIARTSAYVAVFYVCIGAPGMRDMAREHMHRALLLVDTSDKVKDPGTQALVRFKSAKFSTMMGEMKQAGDRVRKALWMCNFLNLERLLLESQTLSLSIQLFTGQVSKAKATLKASVVKMSQAGPNYVVLALTARTACLVGDFELAESCLERIGRMPPGNFNLNHLEATRQLMKSPDPEVHIALALLLARKYGTQNLAVSAAMRGIEALQSVNLSDLNITMFHTTAFLITALAEGLGGTPLLKSRKRILHGKHQGRYSPHMSLSQIIPFEDLEITVPVRTIRKQAGKHLKHVLAILKSYAKVYSICRAHATYCNGVYQKILRGKSRSTTLKTFLQAAREAQETESHYVLGLALLEAGLIDKQYLEGARAAFLVCAGIKKDNKAGFTPEQLKEAPYELRLMNEDVLANE
ncbi:Adenylate cyclase type 10 [Hondaea fermentalgiana]|uniref:Adenylate cyclase type 10 n=1 Tax=Hondaea fermentalgiana TaxID=2315210 RepID=A0A2R5GE93_9STRA|nr:Adenylate cyclase type 10 [Hondaea fermentalgiana]|eukprot:GBG26953.1 Adenylate cyclase type 10 [Hondaea fermentalgiana]